MMDKKKLIDGSITPLLVIQELEEDGENSKPIRFSGGTTFNRRPSLPTSTTTATPTATTVANSHVNNNINNANDDVANSQAEQAEKNGKDKVPNNGESPICNTTLANQEGLGTNYITPIEDPYQKAMIYFAKHNILELFSDLTTDIVFKRPDTPLKSMVNELEKLQERELHKKGILTRIKMSLTDGEVER